MQEKLKLGVGESMKFLLSSRYVRDLAALVVAYGISINLVEVTWKSKLKAQVNLHIQWHSFFSFSPADDFSYLNRSILARTSTHPSWATSQPAQELLLSP